MLLPDLRTVLISALCGALLGGIIGFVINGWRLGADIATLKTAQMSLQATLSQNTTEYITKARKAELDNSVKIAGLSNQLHAEMSKNVQIEHDRDVAITNGSQRVSVRAHCPAIEHLSADSSAANGANDITPELNPAYRQTLSDLRLGAANAVDQIIGLQAYARECIKICGTP